MAPQLLRQIGLLVVLRLLSGAAVTNKQAQKLNREVCTFEKLRWDVLEPAAAAKALRDCGIVYWGPETLHATQDYVAELNRSAHNLLRKAPKAQRVLPGMNRDGRQALIPSQTDTPFNVSILRRIADSPLGDTLQIYFGGDGPGLSYVELWWSPSGVANQEIHTDGGGGSIIVFWLLDDLGTLPQGQNGEFIALPGCFNPSDEESAPWCAKVEDKRVHKVNWSKLDMRVLHQPGSMGSGFMYDTNLLHAGCINKSPRKKLAYTISVFDQNQKEKAESEMSTVADSYGKKAQAINKKWQSSWDGFFAEKRQGKKKKKNEL